MKRLFTIIPLLLFQVMIGQTESATVVYKITLNSDSLKDVSDQLLKRVIENSDSVYATLNFNAKESKYALDFDISKVFGTPNLTRTFGGGTGIYYFNQETNEFLKETLTLGYPVIIMKEPVVWTILNEEKKLIGGYLCTKAVRERSEINARGMAKKSRLEAWFCPDIPFRFGPERFFGLSGLVLEAQSNLVHFELEKITWHDTELDIYKPFNAEIMDEEAFKQRAGEF